MKRYFYFLLLTCLSFNMYAQSSTPQKPCSAPEASQFDFWVGNWDLIWKDTNHGTNTILKIMDGCTVNENFNSPSQNYSGSSWSVYNPTLKLWQQTWVDNQGGYITLSGKFENGAMTLTTQSSKLPDGSEIIYHMIYYNISKENFDWKWESSKDNGITWQTNWLIHYKRKSS